MADNILRIGAEFDVSAIVSGSQQAGVALDSIGSAVARQAAIFQKQGLTTEETAQALRGLGYSSAEVSAALGVEAVATEATTAATSGLERAAAGAAGRVLGMEAGLGMAGGALGRVASFLPGMGPLFAAALPIALITMAVQKIEEFADEVEKASRKAQEFAIDSYKVADSIEVENLKLGQQIELLEGGVKSNNLKIAIMEAQIAAESLGKTLESDTQASIGLLNVGGLSQFFTSASGNEKQFKDDLQKIVNEIQDARLRLAQAPAGSPESKAAIQAQIDGYKKFGDQIDLNIKKLQEESAANVAAVQASAEMGAPIALPTNFDESIRKLKDLELGAREAQKSFEAMQERMALGTKLGGLEDVKAQSDEEKKLIDERLKSQNAGLSGPTGRVEQIENEIRALGEKETAEKRVAQAAGSSATSSAAEARISTEYDTKRIELTKQLAAAKEELSRQDFELLNEVQIHAQEEMKAEQEQVNKQFEASWKEFSETQSIQEEITKEVTQEIEQRKKADESYAKSVEQTALRRLKSEEQAVTGAARLEEMRHADESPMRQARRVSTVDRTEVEQLRSIKEEEYQIELTYLQKQLALRQEEMQNAGPESPAQYSAQIDAIRSMYEQIEALHAQHNNEMARLDEQQARNAQLAANAQAQAWKPVEQSVEQGMAKVIQTTFEGTVRTSEAFRRMGAQMVIDVAEAFERMVIHAVVNEARMLLIHTTTNQAKAASDASTAAQTQSIGALAALKEVVHAAASAAAKAYSATVGIPIVGPFIAPAAAAATFAGVMAFESFATAEHGALVPQDMPIYAHAQEMVLPAHIATPLQGAIPAMQTFSNAMDAIGPRPAFAGAGAGGGGGDTTHVHMNVSALDSKSVADFLHSNRAQFTKLVRTAVRNGTRFK